MRRYSGLVRTLALSAILSAVFVLVASFSVQAQTKFLADSPVSVRSILVPNNTTAVVIKASYGVVYAVEVMNNDTTIAYVKLYNAATATCGSGTPVARYMIPISTAVTYRLTNGDAYPRGIVSCVTTGYADNDTTAPTAAKYIVNIHYK